MLKWGNGSNDYPTSALLHRKVPANSRNWLSNKNKVDTTICPVPHGTVSQQCDEYPFNSSEEGGEDNYIAGNVSIYLVFAQPYFPLSFYVTRQGKFKLF